MSTALLRLCAAILFFLVASTVAIRPLAAEPRPLRAYNAAIGDSSISGISSGAFMAVQFATAWSSVITGVGVVAGGPYWCAKADGDDFINAYTLPALTAIGPCMQGPPPALNISFAKADAKAASGEIDPLLNLGRQKIYLFHGYNDKVVAKSITDATADFYRHYLGAANLGNLYYQTALGAGHSLVVIREQPTAGLNDCNANQSPYIDQCGYDQAGAILQHIYGALNPPNRGALNGTVKHFDQSLYTQPDIPDALSMADEGFAYVPKVCDSGEACRVHIALHGCKQDAGDIGARYVDDTGYNSWADTNRLIVLYPQTKSSVFSPQNPEACWDWWSYVNHQDSYVTKTGPQIRSIKAMLDALTAGAKPGAPTTALPPAPTALAVIDTSDNAADLAWSAAAGAASYRVSRAGVDGVFAPVGEVKGLSFGDAGLAPKTTYRWRVAAVANGVEGAPSTEVVGVTLITPAPCNNPGSCPIGN
jgi:hypothetical protein